MTREEKRKFTTRKKKVFLKNEVRTTKYLNEEKKQKQTKKRLWSLYHAIYISYLENDDRTKYKYSDGKVSR